MKASNILQGIRLIAISSFIGSAVVAKAQSFQISDFIPPVGFPWRHTIVNSLAPLDTTLGINEVWNYEDMVIEPGEGLPTTSILPANVPYNSAFPNATLAIGPVVPTTNTSCAFYGEHVNGLELLGWAYTSNGGNGVFYGDPKLCYPAMDLGDTLVDPFCYGYVNSFVSPDTFDMCGSMVISFTSTGTLQLPYGNFPNTRLLTIRDYRHPSDSAAWDRYRAADLAARNTVWYPKAQYVPSAPHDWFVGWYGHVADFDPVPYLRKVKAPVLWLYGDEDTQSDIMRNVGIIEQLQTYKPGQFEVARFTATGMLAPVDGLGNALVQLATPQGFFETLEKWLRPSE